MSTNQIEKKSVYLFKHTPTPCTTQFVLAKDLNFVVWNSSFFNLVPKGIPFNWRYVFYKLWFLENKNYKAFLVYTKEGSLVHQSLVFPKYFRFPFMKKEDLQITSLFTNEEFRGLGIAKFIIQEILKTFPTHSFWYLVRSHNTSSISVAKQNNFINHGLANYNNYQYRFSK
jgi:GNAT superfamily N-acetyltransferase